MLKQIDLNKFNKLSKNVEPELIAHCFNNETTLSDNTKLVIIGTLTTPNTAYFYCAYLNRIYGYIDEAVKEKGVFIESLKELKIGLSKYEKKGIELLPKDELDKRVKRIKEILSEYGIAFLDVMDAAIRRRVSSDDKDIMYYVLAKDNFDQIPENATIVANSKTALDCVNQIGVKNPIFLSQRSGKKEKWIKTIVDAL